MPLRPCLDCGQVSNASRCDACRSRRNRQRDQQRGSSTARGYGTEHRAERAAWEPIVQAGGVTCRRYPSGQCVAPAALIRPDEPWHLGHPDAQCPAPKAPEHVVCNDGAPRRAEKSSPEGARPSG